MAGRKRITVRAAIVQKYVVFSGRTFACNPFAAAAALQTGPVTGVSRQVALSLPDEITQRRLVPPFLPALGFCRTIDRLERKPSVNGVRHNLFEAASCRGESGQARLAAEVRRYIP
jgi:hypothetical protein